MQMDNLERAMVSLLIHGDELVPEEVSALLGALPDIGVRKGESFLSSSGKTIAAKTGRWTFTLGWRAAPDIDELIMELLGALSEKVEVWDDLAARFDCYLSVGLYFVDCTGGMVFRPGTLRAVGERGLTLDFDMYASVASS